jgi:polysaccharide pyruvyl transferase CsaB
MSATSPRLTIVGYYGLGNCGDEAVLAGLLRGLREAVPEARVTVLSANPRATSRLHNVRSVHRVRGLLQSLMFCDALIAGGGSLLQDVTSQRSLLYYLFVLKAALAFGKKVVLLGQGVGPLMRRRSRQAVAEVLNRVDAIALRDSQSRSLLKELGVTKARIEVCADLAFLLDPPSFEVARSVIGEGERCLALSLRPWNMQLNDEEDWRRAARQASILCEELGRATRLTVRLVPMQEPWDRILAEHAAMLAVWPTSVEPVRPPTETVAGFAAYRVVVAMRLHALVFAALADVPSVALSYDPKVSAFMETVGRSEWTLPHDAPPQQIAEAARRAYSYAEPYPPGRIEWLRRLARRNITILREVLGP